VAFWVSEEEESSISSCPLTSSPYLSSIPILSFVLTRRNYTHTELCSLNLTFLQKLSQKSHTHIHTARATKVKFIINQLTITKICSPTTPAHPVHRFDRAFSLSVAGRKKAHLLTDPSHVVEVTFDSLIRIADEDDADADAA